jgi:TonB family protein
MTSPSLSMPSVPRRNTTAIAVVVIIDLVLASAGAILLAKGLSKPAAAAKSAQDPPPKLNAAVPEVTRDGPSQQSANSAKTAEPPVAGSATAAPAVALPEPGKEAAEPKAAEPKVDHKHHDSKQVSANPKPALASDSPVELYDETSAPAVALAPEVERKAGQSAGVFSLCHDNAGTVRGIIQVAFRVNPDGRVANVTTVENTTGSDQLARCLVNTIAAWTFQPRTGDAADFVRPFKYD